MFFLLACQGVRGVSLPMKKPTIRKSLGFSPERFPASAICCAQRMGASSVPFAAQGLRPLCSVTDRTVPELLNFHFRVSSFWGPPVQSPRSISGEP